MIRLCLFLLALSVVAQPSGYRNWTSFEGTANGEVPRVYANDVAAQGLGGGPYADGASIVYDLSAARDLSKRRIDWMVRREGKWLFGRTVNGTDVVSPGSEAAAKCAACHAGAKARDGVFLSLPAWSREVAARYLDGRAKRWSEWSVAKAKGGTCVSCHTTMLYLLARPALRRAMGEGAPTAYETQFLDAMRVRVSDREAKPTVGLSVDSVMAALLLGSDAAKTRMWSMQVKEGPARGSMPWYSLDLDPWETGPSAYWGAALAAVAAKDETGALQEYLRREMEGKPLHHRLLLLRTGVLNADETKRLQDETWRGQASDGSWSMESLGPWKDHPAKPAGGTATAFATAYAAYALQYSSGACGDPRMAKALAWLRRHQSEAGNWTASSMNKVFPADSMQIGFMDDAATGFAVLALLAEPCAAR